MDQDILQSVCSLVSLRILYYSPLYYIVLGGHKAIVKVLFKHGAKTYISGSKGDIAKLEREIQRSIKKMGVVIGVSYQLRNS